VRSSSPVALGSVDGALAELRAGRPVVVLFDNGRSAGVVMSAGLAEPQWTAWIVRHSSGLLSVGLIAERAETLKLPPMVERNVEPHRSRLAVTVDAARGVDTGISAADRSRTARVLADPSSRPADLNRPGHMLVHVVSPGGVLESADLPEAGVDLCRLAGLAHVALVAQLVQLDGSLADLGAGLDLASTHDLVALDIDALASYRLRPVAEPLARVTRVAENSAHTPYGELRLVRYRDELSEIEHLAWVGGDIAGSARPHVYVHPECPRHVVAVSIPCDCRARLDDLMRRVCETNGVVVYVRRTGAAQYRTAESTASAEHAATKIDDAIAAAIVGDLLPRAQDPS
jgi:3,4-dihydroxy 2-butanone 4-phosphate synthase / GTP cyclohydrolase II